MTEEHYYNNGDSGWWTTVENRFPHKIDLNDYTKREEATAWIKAQTGVVVTMDVDTYCFVDEETSLLFALRFK